MIGSKNKRYGAFPLLMKLIPKNGNYSKLKAAKFLMKLFISYTDASFNIKLLLDAWYMKANLLLPLIKNNVTVIGQVRRDTALYLQPVATKKVGRPRKYGRKLTFELVKQLFTLQEDSIVAYGKERKFLFYSLEAKARFLKGHLCKIVWCRLQQDTGKWTNWHLLLSTDPTLSGSTIIHLYSLRWWTESMFNEIKNLFGLQHAWQQTKQALARWPFILSLAYSIPKLLSLVLEPGEAKSFFSIPWRTEQPITAGWIATSIRFYFQNFKVRCLWDRKSQKMIIKKQHLDSIYGKIA
ncbi:transposase [Desulfohalobiaceae bacterium Ax17]|nr:transposase [Desulfovulcanus ferrireducens]MBT8763764.1 transposase [Desulfovulcanus ferrireducens]